MLKLLIVSTVIFSSFPGIAQDETPKHGRPRYEAVDGYGWMYFMHQKGVDWYVDPTTKEFTSNGFKLFIRSVQPSNISHGPLLIDCKNRRVSVYYEAYEPIDLRLNNLVTRLYKTNCPGL